MRSNNSINKNSIAGCVPCSAESNASSPCSNSLRNGDHPVTGISASVFVLFAFLIAALRVGVLLALAGTAVFVGVGVALGCVIVKKPAPPDALLEPGEDEAPPEDTHGRM